MTPPDRTGRSMRWQVVLHAIAAPVAALLSAFAFAGGGTLSGVFFALVALMSAVAVLAVLRRSWSGRSAGPRAGRSTGASRGPGER